MDINIDSQIVVQTAAQWAADTDVYSEKRILVTSDVYYTGTDQRKFKLANGVDTWSNLDYMPLGGSTTWGGITGTLSNQTDLQNALNAKENSITAGTTGQYWRGDKTFQTLDKTAVGLSNVDNTSDANKPVSTAQQTAIDAKVADAINDGVTTIAPSQNAVFDALALKQDYCLFTHNPSGVINPADGQYYYFGMPNITATNTTSATGTYIRELASPVTGVIEKAVLTIYCGNYATVNSDLSSWIIKNTTNSNTNYTLSSSVNYSTANLIQKIDVTGLSIPVTRGDLLMTLIGNATWATVNPTSVYWVAQYLVRKTS